MSDRAKAITLWAVAVLVGAFACWLLLRDRPPELTAESLSAARAAWRARGPHAYRVRVSTEAAGLARQVYVVHVSGAEASTTKPGQESYAVDGLFTMLEREMDLAHDASVYGAPQGSRAYLYASFDAKLGFPLLFRRIVGGSDRYAEVRVLDFEATPE